MCMSNTGIVSAENIFFKYKKKPLDPILISLHHDFFSFFFIFFLSSYLVKKIKKKS